MTPTVSFTELLHQAVTEPGTISDAYRQFHTYSLGNQLLALWQCHQRGIEPGPMATYPRWQALGRHVRKGEKAIVLCMPVTIKGARTQSDGTTETTRTTEATEQADAATFTRFVYRARWFVLAQTEGDALPEPELPTWDRARALASLKVEEVPFDLADGNCLGFARERTIAMNPINPLLHKTRFHELAHVLLGHTAEGLQEDAPTTPRSLRECEAEAVALLCCAALDLPGVAECRGYVQHWWGQGNPIPERSAQRILKVADQILKAGTTDQGAS